MQNYRDAIRSYGKQVTYEPGTRICDREHPLTAAHLVESGYVTASDHIYVDVGRLGVMFERGDTFGEYAYFEQRDRIVAAPLIMPELPEMPSHGTHGVPEFPSFADASEAPPPPSFRPYPSSLRAVTKVEAIALDISGYTRALAEEPKLEGWFHNQVVVTEHLAQMMDGLRAQGELRRVPGFEIAGMAKNGQATFVPANQQKTFTAGSWVYVAWGQVTVCGGGWTIGAGQMLRYGFAGQPLEAVVDSWVIEIPSPQTTHAASVAQPGLPTQRVVLFWSGDVKVRAEILSAFTAHLAAIQEKEASRPARWKGGLLIVDAPTDEKTAAQQGAADAGVVVQRALSSDLPNAIRDLKTPVVYVDASHCSHQLILETLAPHVTDVVLIGGAPAQLPEPLRSRTVVACAIVPDRSGDDVRSYALNAKRFFLTGFLERYQSQERAYTAEYVPRCVRLSFADESELPTLAGTDLPTPDRESFERIARAVAGRRVGVALGGGGGWGYAHIALLDALDKRGMPIDAVSGVSFGSLVGGYYSVRNLEYVQTLIGDWVQLLASQLGAALLPPVLGWFLTGKLHRTYLEDLVVPFFPVCLNLQVGDEYTPTRGSVAFGVRASSSLPGLLSPAIAKGMRGVDGGYINNVPEGILDREGLHFILASSVVQAPSPGPEPTLPFTWSINPIQRSLDSIRGMGWLMKVSDERDANRARWRFEPFRKDLLRGIQAWELWKGAEIQDRVQREAALVVGRAYRDWLAYWA